MKESLLSGWECKSGTSTEASSTSSASGVLKDEVGGFTMAVTGNVKGAVDN